MVRLDAGWHDIIEQLLEMALFERYSDEEPSLDRIGVLRETLMNRIRPDLHQSFACLLEGLLLESLRRMPDEELLGLLDGSKPAATAGRRVREELPDRLGGEPLPGDEGEPERLFGGLSFLDPDAHGFSQE